MDKRYGNLRHEFGKKRKSSLHLICIICRSILFKLDLEVFNLLPLRKNTTFLITYYEFGYDIPRHITYTIIGEGVFVYDGKGIRC